MSGELCPCDMCAAMRVAWGDGPDDDSILTFVPVEQRVLAPVVDLAEWRRNRLARAGLVATQQGS